LTNVYPNNNKNNNKNNKKNNKVKSKPLELRSRVKITGHFVIYLTRGTALRTIKYYQVTPFPVSAYLDHLHCTGQF
jgi:hypothetical protein